MTTVVSVIFWKAYFSVVIVLSCHQTKKSVVIVIFESDLPSFLGVEQFARLEVYHRPACTGYFQLHFVRLLDRPIRLDLQRVHSSFPGSRGAPHLASGYHQNW